MQSNGEEATFVSCIREDITVENGLAFWIVADNLRKGVSLNAVQIAELLISRNLIKQRSANETKTAA
ncbi:Asd/ArgC dimerization domain-containing protein [Bartonella senegalensis]|uniref:Asd/ArgC dimerization domain-containing protein n=1 Tax=Bartonella senegalensis TaxID=1468418 RepID=UPI000312EED5